MQATLQRTRLVFLMMAVGALIACSAQQPLETTPTDPSGTRTATPPSRQVDQPGQELDAGVWDETPPGGDVLGITDLPDVGVLQTVYFDYDQSEIRPDQRAKLQANAQYLRQNAHFRILIAGHSDERGTREYNMALGEQRASSTMQYLVALGVPRDRIEIITYGEEQPAASGETESSWAQNRRAEFRAIAGGS